jgi:hypothetical protein
MSRRDFDRRHFLKFGSAALTAPVAVLADRAWSAAQERRPAATIASEKAMKRADELVRQMTIEEKSMQVSCVVPLALLDRGGLMRGQADELIKQGICHVASHTAEGNRVGRAPLTMSLSQRGERVFCGLGFACSKAPSNRAGLL